MVTLQEKPDKHALNHTMKANVVSDDVPWISFLSDIVNSNLYPSNILYKNL